MNDDDFFDEGEFDDDGSVDHELVFDSRVTDTPFPMRLDPVYEIDWKSLIGIKWEEQCVYKYRYGSTPDGGITARREEIPAYIRQPKSLTHSPQAIKIVSMLHEWNTLTSFQIRTMLQDNPWRYLKALFLSGVLLRATPDWFRNDTRDSGTGALWRINKQSWALTQWESALTDLESMLTFNNIDYDFVPRGANSETSLRHNLIGAEVAIRAMEVIPDVIGYFGEPHCSGDDFLFEEIPVRNYQQLLDTVGDLSIITKSGDVIVFEIVGGNAARNQSASIANKAAKWGVIIAHSPIPLKVVFLDSYNGGFSGKGALANALQYAAEKLMPSVMPRQRLVEEAKSRMFVATTMDWFPMPRNISTQFLTLQSTSPFDGLDYDLITEDTGVVARDYDVTINALASLATPSWIVRQPVSLNE